jgi:large subunit ribosomal protein L21
MWEKFVKQWTDLIFWWAPRDEQKPAQNPEVTTPSKSEERVEPLPKPSPMRAADDLTVIKGIGPAVQRKLTELNIVTFGDLAEAEPEALTEEFKGSQPISIARVRAWTEAARERSQI